ncbi:MAG: hypothetical protein RL189_3218 [Pseudomonadota bacterium]
MNNLLAIALSLCAGVAVAVGLFLHTAGVILQRRSFKGFLIKFTGLIPLGLALYLRPEAVMTISLTFFVTASIFLVFLSLARNRLLR